MILEGLTFDDVLLCPKYSEIRSRREIDISNNLGSLLKLELPIISSCMDTVTEENMAIQMSLEGGLGIIHRYCSIVRQVEMVRICNEHPAGTIDVGAAIGVTGDFKERALALVSAGARILCLDVAHRRSYSCERSVGIFTHT